ncbi:hypothetical protein [Chryseobacterium lathyri]|uniref:hypothetical protein n=1 Tax=Chryseobacterium lathyri TaxID=395933 RepID=UPI00278337F1|nr:hypothetical protein [Chryseobacterium lathyri]MDQ0068170.1 hypothetical protein [Chryseobacterium lathyri]
MCRVNFMLTNDSIDVFMLQKLQSKQGRYLEAMKKGADVLDISDITQIEYQTKITENKIAELYEKLEDLPAVRDNLVVQYRIEKSTCEIPKFSQPLKSSPYRTSS